ncbi:MAG: hypothetical protein HKO56_05325 [Bacteroidia bacterium]|nr:hypothetical protein [Bacteroidia bacterium]
MKSAIIVGDYKRPDVQFYLKAVSSKYKLYLLLLDFSSSKSRNTKVQFGEKISIKDFKNANHLLKSLNISKVFFFAFENIHEVLFNVCCKNLEINTVHIEHGVRDYERTLGLSKLRKENDRKTLFQRWKQKSISVRQIPERITLKRFFNKSLNLLSKGDQKFIKHYVKIRRTHSYLETSRLVTDEKRMPASYISFSQKTFEFHMLKDCLQDLSRVSFIGCPQFDDLFNLKKANEQELVFIDQPFVEFKVFGWTYQYKFELIQQINDKIVEPFNFKLKIKPHPYSNMEFWNKCKSQFSRIEIIDQSGFNSNDIVIGFASTMLIPLVAQNDTVCISIEKHPEIDFNYSDFLSSSDAITQVNSIEELKNCISSISQLKEKQSKAKPEFIKDWLYLFDGKSYDRLLEVV